MKHTLQNRFGRLPAPFRQNDPPHEAPAGCPVHGQGNSSTCPSPYAVERFTAKAPAQLTAEELGQAISAVLPLAAWLDEAKSCALDLLLSGKAVPGWKAVEGRSNRRFTDVAAAFEALRGNGVAEAALYERRPLSPTQVEKLIGKAEFHRLAAPFVERPLGKPMLAPENDPRSPYPSCTQA